MAIAEQFAGLPLGQLIAQPLVEVAKGQAALCEVYLSYLFRMAYKDGKAGNETNLLTFKLNRQIISENGDSKTEPINIEAPLYLSFRCRHLSWTRPPYASIWK